MPILLPESDRLAFDYFFERLMRSVGAAEHHFSWSLFDQIQMGESDQFAEVDADRYRPLTAGNPIDARSSAVSNGSAVALLMGSLTNLNTAGDLLLNLVNNTNVSKMTVDYTGLLSIAGNFKLTGATPSITATAANTGIALVGTGAGSLTWDTNKFSVSSTGATTIAGNVTLSGATPSVTASAVGSGIALVGNGAGSLTWNATALTVDSVGNVTATGNLHTTGGSLVSDGDLSVAGNVTLSNAASPTITASGAGSGISLVGNGTGSLTWNTNKFSVSSVGATSIAGNVTLSGATPSITASAANTGISLVGTGNGSLTWDTNKFTVDSLGNAAATALTLSQAASKIAFSLPMNGAIGLNGQTVGAAITAPYIYYDGFAIEMQFIDCALGAQIGNFDIGHSVNNDLRCNDTMTLYDTNASVSTPIVKLASSTTHTSGNLLEVYSDNRTTKVASVDFAGNIVGTGLTLSQGSSKVALSIPINGAICFNGQAVGGAISSPFIYYDGFALEMPFFDAGVGAILGNFDIGHTVNNDIETAATMTLYNTGASASTPVVTIASSTTHTSGNLFEVYSDNRTTNKFAVDFNGKTIQSDYSDQTGTPGNVTANAVTGRAAIASGASTCVVTNSRVTATSIILLQMESDGTGVASLVLDSKSANTSFTVKSVNGTGVVTNTTGNTTFSWIIFN